jgi:shikimate kinase
MLGRQNIFLIGPMGSGKSAVGRYLARLLDFPFYDSDHEIERRSGADVPLVFETEGEAGFRRREREVIAELTQREPIVLATGGGAILDPQNRRDLAGSGWVVFLDASVSQQVERTGRSRNRPLLHGAEPTVRLAELMLVREPLYREIADYCILTDQRRVHWVAERVMREYKATRQKP